MELFSNKEEALYYEENSDVIVSTQNIDMLINALDKNSKIFKETTELFSKLKLLMSELI